MYVILVGKPGSGKGAAIRPVHGFLKESGTANLLTDRMSIEWAVDQMSKGFVTQACSASGMQIAVDNSALIIAPEMSGLIRRGLDVLGDLCALWDSTEYPYQYGTLSGKLRSIDRQCCSLFGGTTPKWIARHMPEDSSGEGFTRRVNYVYEKKGRRVYHTVNGVAGRDAIVDDLRYIHTHIQGAFTFETQAEKIFHRIYDESEPDEFDDEAVEGYKTSKWVHCAKLAMVLSVSRNDARTITCDDLNQAEREVDRLIEDLPMVFRAVGEADLVEAADKVLQFVEAKGYATWPQIMKHTWKYVGSGDNLRTILTTLTDANLIYVVDQGNKVIYKPVQTGVTP